MDTINSQYQSLVWHFFEEICQIPRPSGHEQAIIAYLQQFALKHGFLSKTDAAGNLVIIKPGEAPAIALQAHVDMVCEKQMDSTHNFLEDPINTYTEDGWLKAKGTTLGADNGIGIALALASLLDYQGNKQLEALFTVEEETGLTGAAAVKADFISAPILLNLDSEDDRELIIGCAGGCETAGYWKIEEMDCPQGMFFVEVTIKGLQGGHSGSDIHLPRANANKLLGQFLKQTQEKYPFYLHSINGGGLHNAIAREATALFAVPFADREHIRIDWNIYIAEQEDIWLKEETKMRFDLTSRPAKDKVYTTQLTNGIVQALCQCKHGVIKMSEQIEGVVETSINLASIQPKDGNLVMVSSQRSMYEEQLNALAFETYQTLTECGATAAIYNGYPAWQPRFDSPLLKKAKETYQAIFKREADVKVIHAGLECGLFYQTNPKLDLLSFGPTLLGVHSPKERLNIESTNQVAIYLRELLKTL